MLLEPCAQAPAPLQLGQVRVQVRAVGVNFRDVVMALGMYPGPAELGGEGAGVVVEVGAGVTGVAVGDHVMGLLGAAGPEIVVDQRLIVRVPPGWSFAEAAGVSMVFLTAYYGLADLAGVRAGESVLIHAATGGVGMAAVQLARHWGVEAFVTASRDKWDTLRAMGFDEDHIADSRTLEFAEKFLSATGGRGVDVVLNSLAGEFVDASLRLLPDGGRFIEMGKADIRDPQVIAKTHSGVLYRAFDLAEAGPQRMEQMLAELSGLFDTRTVHPAAGHYLGHPVCPTRPPVRQPGPPHRQSGPDHARSNLSCPGGGHGVDYWWDRNGRGGAGPACGASVWGGTCGAGQSPWGSR